MDSKIDLSSNFIKLIFGLLTTACIAIVSLLITLNLKVNTVIVDQSYMKTFIENNTIELNKRSDFMTTTDTNIILIQNEIRTLKEKIELLEDKIEILRK